MSVRRLSAAEALGRVPSVFRGVAIEPEAGMVGRHCACGETVWADPANPMPGVAAHNAGRAHTAWGARIEASESGTAPTTATGAVDLSGDRRGTSGPSLTPEAVA